MAEMTSWTECPNKMSLTTAGPRLLGLLSVPGESRLLLPWLLYNRGIEFLFILSCLGTADDCRLQTIRSWSKSLWCKLWLGWLIDPLFSKLMLGVDKRRIRSPNVVFCLRSMSIDSWWRQGYRGGGKGGAEQSAKELPWYMYIRETRGDSPGGNCRRPSSCRIPP